MNNAKQYEAELDSICVEFKHKYNQRELSDAFNTLAADDDDVLNPDWSDATKDVWLAMDRLYEKYNDENDVEFCGVSILFEDMEPRCVG